MNSKEVVKTDEPSKQQQQVGAANVNNTVADAQTTEYIQSMMQYYQTYYPDYYSQLVSAGYPPVMTSSSSSSASKPPVGGTPYPSQSGYSYPTYSSMTRKVDASAIPEVTHYVPGSRVGTEKALRQMSHFFNYDAYVEQMNKKDALKPTKFTKKEIETLKQRRMDKKKKKMIEWLRTD